MILFLNALLFLNLGISIYKRNQDFIGLVIGLFFLIHLIDVLKSAKNRQKSKRKLLILNHSTFSMLVILNITNMLTYLYSAGIEVKIIRSLEYFQAFLLVFLFKFKKYKYYKRYIPHISLTYLLVPPASVMMDSSSILSVQSWFLILILMLWFFNKLRQRLTYSHLSLIVPGVFIFFPIISGLGNGFGYNLREYIFLNLLIIVSTYLVAQSLDSRRKLLRYFRMFLLIFVLKIFYITFYVMDIPTRGGVNNNLYGINFEFLFFIAVFLFLETKTISEKIFYLLLSFLILVCFFNLVSRSPIISIIYTLSFALFWKFINRFGYFNTKSFEKTYLISHLVAILGIFLFLIRYSEMASIIIRKKIWELGWRGIHSDIKYLFIGFGDFGKINLMQWIHQNDFSSAFPFDTGLVQTHLHNDFIALLYGSGVFALILYFIFILYFTKKSLIAKYLPIGLILVAYSIHGLTEPILTNIYTAFLFWLPMQMLILDSKKDKNHGLPSVNGIFFTIKTILVFLIVYMLFSIYENHKTTKFIYNHPHLKMQLRGFGAEKIELGEKDKIEFSNLIENLNKVSTSPALIGNSENQADLFFLDYHINQNEKSYQRSSEIYCTLFLLQPIPRNYNNIRNIARTKNEDFVTLCSADISNKLKVFDRYNLIDKDFY